MNLLEWGKRGVVFFVCLFFCCYCCCCVGSRLVYPLQILTKVDEVLVGVVTEE